jgi:hypothetical protein
MVCFCVDEHATNRATIRLYWAVNGLVAEWIGCLPEDLAVVVLTPELAHAYTQLGADTEGRRWPAENFARCELALTEGLAQYYTHRVLHRLRQRYDGALRVYRAMLKQQADARTMLEVRRWDEKKVEAFESRLRGAQQATVP